MYIFYNAYIIKSVYFSYGILKISLQQEAISMCIYEVTLLWKLNLSTKFLRSILYAHKSAAGISIIKPSIIVNTLVMKLYISHKWQQSRILKFISVNEEIESIYYSFTKYPITISNSNRYRKVIWSN